jgi:hypothetical protein
VEQHEFLEGGVRGSRLEKAEEGAAAPFLSKASCGLLRSGQSSEPLILLWTTKTKNILWGFRVLQLIDTTPQPLLVR